MAMAVSLHSAASGKPHSGDPVACGASRAWAGSVDQPPERAGGGEDVGVGQRALGKPDGIKGGERDGPEGDGGHAHQAHGQPPDRHQAEAKRQ